MSKIVRCFVGYAGQTVVLWKDCQWAKEDLEKELRLMKKGHVEVVEVSRKKFRQIERARARN